jgi:hypothetical protein
VDVAHLVGFLCHSRSFITMLFFFFLGKNLIVGEGGDLNPNSPHKRDQSMLVESQGSWLYHAS